MPEFGFFVFLSVGIYLIDKNQAWSKLWRALKAGTIVALVALTCFAGYSYWSARREAARQIDFSKYEGIDKAKAAK